MSCLPLVKRANIVFHPLHINLSLTKQFVKALPADSTSIKYLIRVFPGLSVKKIKAGVSDGPQIRQLLKDDNFPNSMKNIEKEARQAFKYVVYGFLGNKKSEQLQRNSLRPI